MISDCWNSCAHYARRLSVGRMPGGERLSSPAVRAVRGSFSGCVLNRDEQTDDVATVEPGGVVAEADGGACGEACC
jgi:hypothetical protein